MYCVNCGKEIPNDSKFCTACGHKVNTVPKTNETPFEITEDEVTVCVSANPIQPTDTNTQKNEVIKSKNIGLWWSALGVLSFIFMFMNYASVSVYLSYSSSDSAFSGFGLIDCMDGTLGTAARMMVLLIIVNFAIIVTGIVYYKTTKYNKIVTPAIFVEAILSIIASFIAINNIGTEMSEFNSSLSDAFVGPGAYLNLALSFALLIFAFYIKKKRILIT